MFSGLLDSGTGGERDFLWKSTSLRGSLGGVFGERPGTEAPHASRARGTVADILYYRRNYLWDTWWQEALMGSWLKVLCGSYGRGLGEKSYAEVLWQHPEQNS